jgi:hypothetical protein
MWRTKMISEYEMETWQEVWKVTEAELQRPDRADLSRMVKRRQLRLRILQVLEFAWALFLLVLSYAVARHYPSTEMFIWAVVVWILTLIATVYSIWNWRVLWNAGMRSVSDYARIYEKYCRQWLRYIRFGYWFLVVNLAISIPWLSWKYFRSSGAGHFSLTAYLISMGLIAGLTAGYLIWFSRSRRKRLSELECLTQYRKSLDGRI